MRQILGWLLYLKLGYDGFLPHLFSFHNNLPIQRPMIRAADGMSLNKRWVVSNENSKGLCGECHWCLVADGSEFHAQRIADLRTSQHLLCLIAKFLDTSFASLLFTLNVDTWKQTGVSEFQQFAVTNLWATVRIRRPAGAGPNGGGNRKLSSFVIYTCQQVLLGLLH